MFNLFQHDLIFQYGYLKRKQLTLNALPPFVSFHGVICNLLCYRIGHHAITPLDDKIIIMCLGKIGVYVGVVIQNTEKPSL